jgi:hypothetical protein
VYLFVSFKKKGPKNKKSEKEQGGIYMPKK